VTDRVEIPSDAVSGYYEAKLEIVGGAYADAVGSVPGRRGADCGVRCEQVLISGVDAALVGGRQAPGQQPRAQDVSSARSATWAARQAAETGSGMTVIRPGGQPHSAWSDSRSRIASKLLCAARITGNSPYSDTPTSTARETANPR
jgi:hypothetical protein